jgi:sugar O-acyltransferase (sialic acid O-acetyltransferase NeuD family)
MIDAPPFIVVGAGGHAKVVIATIEAAGGKVIAVLDDDPSRRGTRVLGHVVEGPATAERIPAGIQVLLAVGSNRARRELSLRLGVRYATIIHPSAVVSPSARLGDGTVVFAGAVIQPDATIGTHAIVNTSASVDHDCELGDFVHVAPGARLAGGVRLGEGVLMGIASSAIPGCRVGAWATVGAGGVVTRTIPADAVAVGVPARVTVRKANRFD